MQRKLTCLWKDPGAPKGYRSAVSLHSHTNRSKEGLTFIAKYAARHALLQFALATQTKEAMRKGGIVADFGQAYWTPPLPPLEAFELERDQIERVLGVAPMVSLTDHDNIEAPMLLRMVPEARRTPVSVEWSMPYRDTTLHLGIHNLPSARAEAIMAQLGDYTENPRTQHLRDLLKMLHENPEVLIVLNHPMWDLAGIGNERHIGRLHDFAAELGMFVHAFELSGVRTWEENRAVLEFADKWNQPVIGGGDRHGTEPNAILNLTDAQSFSEFVDEVRRKRQCYVLLMPQYAQPFTLRVFQSLLDVIRTYPDHPKGSRRWDERVFHPGRNGEVQPLAELWRRPPVYVEAFFMAVRLLEIPTVQSAIQSALAKPEHEMHLALGRGEEAGTAWTNTYGLRSFQTHTRRSTGWRTPAANLRRSRENAGSPS